MPLVGTGGSANTAGSNPAGIGQGLNYVGNHAYGTSGSITNAGTGSASTTLFNFTTGSEYIVGSIDFTSTNAAGHDTYFDIYFDGSLVFETKEANSALVPFRFNVIIPAYTHVEVKWGSNDTYNGSAFIQGRVY
jgi:hypothetical protein